MSAELRGVDKVAILFFMLNEDAAAQVMSLLEDSEVKSILRAMSSLGKIEQGAIKNVLFDFIKQMEENFAPIVGTISTAEKFLRKVLGDDKANDMIHELRSPTGVEIWEKINKMPVRTIAAFLEDESPQSAAIILSHVDSASCSKILSVFKPEASFEIIKRMLFMQQVDRDVMTNLEEVLNKEFVHGKSRSQGENVHIVAELFNNFDKSNETKFMKLLEAEDANIAAKVRKLMFTFQDLTTLDSSGVQRLIRDIDKSKMALALSSATEEIIELFMENMSRRAFKILEEEIQMLGQQRQRDVEEAQNYIVSIAKNMLRAGIIKRYEEDNIL